MKLRLLGNKIRFRLSQPEVLALKEIKFVQSTLMINPFEINNFKYSVHCDDDINEAKATFQNNELRVEIPSSLVNAWADSEDVGIVEGFTGNSGEEIIILVEKDFKCLTERGENETELFDNPDTEKDC